jgi:hypothetical protein
LALNRRPAILEPLGSLVGRGGGGARLAWRLDGRGGRRGHGGDRLRGRRGRERGGCWLLLLTGAEADGERDRSIQCSASWESPLNKSERRRQITRCGRSGFYTQLKTARKAKRPLSFMLALAAGLFRGAVGAALAAGVGVVLEALWAWFWGLGVFLTKPMCQ